MPRGRRSFEAVMAYRNRDVVDRFLATWDVTRPEANLVFEDLKRFLWLAATVDGTIQPVGIVDEMWHAFLMFTKEYTAWTTRAFGRFLHHVPTTEREKRAMRKTRDEIERELTHAVSKVVDVLGPKVAKRWYVTYPARYDERLVERERRSAGRRRARTAATGRRAKSAA